MFRVAKTRRQYVAKLCHAAVTQLRKDDIDEDDNTKHGKNLLRHVSKDASRERWLHTPFREGQILVSRKPSSPGSQTAS